jgi:hypothetical protein
LVTKLAAHLLRCKEDVEAALHLGHHGVQLFCSPNQLFLGGSSCALLSSSFDRLMKVEVMQGKR